MRSVTIPARPISPQVRLKAVSAALENLIPQPKDELGELAALAVPQKGTRSESIEPHEIPTRGDLKRLLIAGGISNNVTEVKRLVSSLHARGLLTKNFVKAATSASKELSSSNGYTHEYAQSVLSQMVSCVENIYFQKSDAADFAKIAQWVTSATQVADPKRIMAAIKTAGELRKQGVPLDEIVKFCAEKALKDMRHLAPDDLRCELDFFNGPDSMLAQLIMDITPEYGFLDLRAFFLKFLETSETSPTLDTVRALCDSARDQSPDCKAFIAEIGDTLKTLNMLASVENIAEVGNLLKQLQWRGEATIDFVPKISSSLWSFAEPRSIEHLRFLASLVTSTPSSNQEKVQPWQITKCMMPALVNALGRPITLQEGKAFLEPLSEITDRVQATRVFVTILQQNRGRKNEPQIKSVRGLKKVLSESLHNQTPASAETLASYHQLACDVRDAFQTVSHRQAEQLNTNCLTAWAKSFQHMPNLAELSRMVLLLSAETQLPETQVGPMKAGIQVAAKVLGRNLRPALLEACLPILRDVIERTDAQYATRVFQETLINTHASKNVGDLSVSDIRYILMASVAAYPQYLKRQAKIEREYSRSQFND